MTRGDAMYKIMGMLVKCFYADYKSYSCPVSTNSFYRNAADDILHELEQSSGLWGEYAC